MDDRNVAEAREDAAAPDRSQRQGSSQGSFAEFERVLAHELESPLGVVQTAATLAVKGDGELSPDERRYLLDVVVRNTDLAIRMLRRLSFARDVGLDDVELARSDVDLGRLVGDAVDDLRHTVLQEHLVNVTVTAGPTILADATATHEIMFNLLSNAAKYSRPGAGIEITVATDGAVAEVVVRNHGSGVTPGDSERIFGKYERADPTAPGVGLGLFVARGLARAHGGDLQVQPARDVGSEFRLTLPTT